MDHGPSRRPSLVELVAAGTLSADLAALLWLLSEGGVPLVAAGGAPHAARSGVARAVVGIDASRPWVVLDADERPLTLEQLGALIRGGVCLGIALAAPDLEAVTERLAEGPPGMPQDAVRRLGVVLVIEEADAALRVSVAHYLRPTERDARGHVQRRPPAVLAAWDARAGHFEDYSWAVTPELAAAVGRTQADLEERCQERALLLARLAAEGVTAGHSLREAVAAHLAAEPAHP
jgi:hypothetical protein